MVPPLWHPNATHRLTTRATSLQLYAWNREARATGRTPAQFLAWAADFAASVLRAMREADTPEEEPARDIAEVERRARERQS
jgi:hypothetical protein